jgi:hypothetical protein
MTFAAAQYCPAVVVHLHTLIVICPFLPKAVSFAIQTPLAPVLRGEGSKIVLFSRLSGCLTICVDITGASPVAGNFDGPFARLYLI